MSSVNMFFWKVEKRSTWLVRSKNAETTVTAEGLLKGRRVRHPFLSNWGKCMASENTPSDTAGPPVTSFHSAVMLMRKKSWFQTRATVCVGFAPSPQACVAFLQVFHFPPTSRRCVCEMHGLSPLSPCERVRVWVALRWKSLLSRAGPTLCP